MLPPDLSSTWLPHFNVLHSPFSLLAIFLSVSIMLYSRVLVVDMSIRLIELILKIEAQAVIVISRFFENRLHVDITGTTGLVGAKRVHLSAVVFARAPTHRPGPRLFVTRMFGPS